MTITDVLWGILAALALICWLLYWILSRLANIHKTVIAIFQYGSEKQMRDTLLPKDKD